MKILGQNKLASAVLRNTVSPLFTSILCLPPSEGLRGDTTQHNSSCVALHAGPLLLLLLRSPQLCQACVHNPLLFGCAALGSVSIARGSRAEDKACVSSQGMPVCQIPSFSLQHLRHLIHDHRHPPHYRQITCKFPQINEF